MIYFSSIIILGCIFAVVSSDIGTVCVMIHGSPYRIAANTIMTPLLFPIHLPVGGISLILPSMNDPISCLNETSINTDEVYLGDRLETLFYEDGRSIVWKSIVNDKVSCYPEIFSQQCFITDYMPTIGFGVMDDCGVVGLIIGSVEEAPGLRYSLVQPLSTLYQLVDCTPPDVLKLFVVPNEYVDQILELPKWPFVCDK